MTVWHFVGLVLTTLLTCFITATLFRGLFQKILIRFDEKTGKVWAMYISLLIYFFGIPAGIGIHRIRKLMKKASLEMEDYLLELLETFIKSLKLIAVPLVIFLVIAMLSQTIVMILNMMNKTKNPSQVQDKGR